MSAAKRKAPTHSRTLTPPTIEGEASGEAASGMGPTGSVGADSPTPLASPTPSASLTPSASPTPSAFAPDDIRSPEWQQDFLARFRLEQTRIPERFRNKSLDNFKIQHSSKRSAVLQAARSYVASFNFENAPPNGLLVMGVVGCGKTHIATAVLRGVVLKGYTGLFYNMPDLLSDIRATFDEKAPLSENDLLEDVNRPDLLVLDDLGAERTSSWVNDRLYLIINRRYDSGRPILVTTNLDLGELSDKIGDRIVSRLCEMCHKFPEFPDEDYRKEHMK